MDGSGSFRKKFADKALGELKEFIILSFYLYICFGAVILYTASVLRSHGVSFEPYGFALFKALIIAKFILIGNSIDIGKFLERGPRIYSLLYRSLAYLVLLVLLSVAEEVAAGLIHGRSALSSLSEIGGGTGLQLVATCFLLWLILLPVVGIQEIDDALGPGALHRMFFIADRSRPY